MTAEQRAERATEVRSLYDSMVRIVVKPTWAKLINFHEALSTPVEEPIRRRQERQEPEPKRCHRVEKSNSAPSQRAATEVGVNCGLRRDLPAKASRWPAAGKLVCSARPAPT